MKFSVLISVYEKENPTYLNRSITSVWDEQTLKPNQVVLVKDGPLTSALDNEIARWKAKLSDKLRIVESTENIGLGAALNLGLQVCEYELVARMDTDDIALPTRFAKQVEFMTNNSDVSVLGTFCSIINSGGDVIANRVLPCEHDLIVRSLWACPIIHPSVMFKKNDIVKLGGYDESLKRRQDYELWFRCAIDGLRFSNLPEPLLKYRVLEASYKKSGVKYAWRQAIIGYNGSKKLDLGLMARLAVFFPFFKSVCPEFISRKADFLFKKLDPRKSF